MADGEAGSSLKSEPTSSDEPAFVSNVGNTMKTEVYWSDSEDDEALVHVLEIFEGAKKHDEMDQTSKKNSKGVVEGGSCSECEMQSDLQNQPNVEKKHSRENFPDACSDLLPEEPLKSLRPGYLWVSDFSSQQWCEKQHHFFLTLPAVTVKGPAVTMGSTLHLARELAAHDKVHVKVTSNEDIWAIKVINLLTSLDMFLAGEPIAREVPVFGAPCDQDVFVVGLIDELRFDRKFYTIDLSDLKTRASKRLPSESQQAQNRFQVMLYKKLFDDLVLGKVTKDLIARHLRLRLDSVFGEEIQTHLMNHQIDCQTLNQLLDHTTRRLQSCTCVRSLSIEYVYQVSEETLAQTEVTYDEVDLQQKFLHRLEYWRGARPPEGVEVEEAWKCQRCQFAEVCDWRKKKVEECIQENRKNKYT